MKEAYYFSHDANARNDPDILAMRSKHGIKGYGMYWVVVEMLREQNDYKLKLNGYTSNALAMQMQCDPHYAEEFLKDCIDEFDLLQSDGKHVWSPSLLRRMQRKEEKSEQARKAAMARWDKEKNNEEENKKDADAMQSQCNRNAIKESKGNKKKDNRGSFPGLDIQKTNNGYKYPDEFEAVWEHYPRKKHKKAAWRKWKARRKEGVKNKDLVSAAKNYSLECKRSKTEAKFIKHGATFLGPDEHYLEYISGPPKEEGKPKPKNPFGKAKLI